MADPKLPKITKKPQVGQTASFRPLPQNDLEVFGKVLRFTVETAEKWVAMIKIDRLAGGYASSYINWLDQELEFGHADLVSIDGDKNIFT